MGERAREAARLGGAQPAVCPRRRGRPLRPVEPSSGVPEVPIEPQAGFPEVPVEPQAATPRPEDARRYARVHHGPGEAGSKGGRSSSSCSCSCSCLVQFLQVNCYIQRVCLINELCMPSMWVQVVEIFPPVTSLFVHMP